METLASRISRDGPLNELDAVGWAIRLAKRIEALHSLGVAHGSISPECVLTTAVDRTSKAILVDLRQTPSRVGYQCPERAGGGTVSASDDVWAIAATLYEALTGSPAFGGSTDAESRQRIAGGSPAPLAVFDVGDDDLQHILDTAFQRDRGARTQTAAALRRGLEEWHPDPAVRALPPLEDEDATNDDDDDDDDVRTVMRAADFDDGPGALGTPAPGPGAAGAYGHPAAGAYGHPGAGPAPGAPYGSGGASPGGYTRPGMSPGSGMSPGGYTRPGLAPDAGMSPGGHGQPGGPAAPPRAGMGGHGQPAAAPGGYGPPGVGAYGHPGGGPAQAAPPRAAASQVAVVDPTLDDDEDEARTVMREYPLQPVFDGGVLVSPGMARPGPTEVDLPGQRRVAPTAPGMAPDGAGFPGGPHAAPQNAMMSRASQPEPLSSTQALDMATMNDMSGARGGASKPDAWGRGGKPDAWGGRPRPLTPTHLDDDDDDDVRTVLRESPDDDEAPAPVAPRLGSPMGQQPVSAANAAAAARQGPLPAPPGFGFPGGGGGIDRPSATVVFDQPPSPAFEPAPSAAGLLGPSPVAGFGQQQRFPPAQGIPPGAFSQQSAPSPPSPFASQVGGLLIEPPPQRSGQKALVIALLVTLALVAGAVLLAMRLGLLGAAPHRSPARVVVVMDASPPVVAPVVSAATRG